MSKKSVLYIVITALCFGTMEVALKVGGSTFTALQMNFLRFLIGGILFLPLALKELKKRNLKLTRYDWGYLTLLAAVGICFSMSFFQIAVMNMNAHTAAIVISCNPVFTMIFAHFLVGDRFTKRKVIVLIISAIGLLLVANPFHMAPGNTAKGFVFMFIALVSFSFYTAMGKIEAERLGGVIINCFPFLIASVFNLIVLLVLHEHVLGGITLKTCPVLLYIGLIVTGLGYYTYLGAIESAGPSNASITFFLKPAVAVITAALVLHEQITWNSLLGIAVILVGFYISLKKD